MNSVSPVHLSRTTKLAAAWTSLVRTAGIFALLLLCGLLVFVFGVDYHTRFWTNTSGVFKVGVAAVFGAATAALWRSERGRPYRQVALAFSAAALTNITTWYLAAPFQRWLWALASLDAGTAPALAVGKLVDVVLRLAPIFAVILLAGDNLGSLYVRRGNLRWSLSLGFLALVNLLATSIAVAASQAGDLTLIFVSLPWWLAYALMNAVMEEIWFRGLFLDRLRPLVGTTGVLWLTSLFFGISHLFATYLEPSGAPVFGAIVLTLGLAFGLLMQKTRTIWGSVVYHTAADVFWFVAFGF